MRIDSKEKIETFFNELGIKGEWISYYVNGINRKEYHFKIGEQTFVIEWWGSMGVLKCGAIQFRFDYITRYNTYSRPGDWIEFMRGKVKIHVNIAERGRQ